MDSRQETPVVVDMQTTIDYRTTAGRTVSKFLIHLRDKAEILGIKCQRCGRVYVPPHPNCPACFVRMDQWVPLSGQGTLTTYTVVNYAEHYHPVPPPIIYGVIHLEGANTSLTHIVAGVEPAEVQIGMKVKAVFKQERTGSILDIDYFKPC